MQIDLRDAELSADPIRTQVCIVGGGIAGLVLAHKLAGLGIEVVLLEAGGAGPEPDQQSAAAQVDMLGAPHAGSTEGRTFALGGSSLTWGGQLLPLPPSAAEPDAASLRAPQQTLGSAWPIPEHELHRFQSEAEHLLRVNELPYEAAAFFRAVKEALPALWEGLPRSTTRLSKFVPFAHRNLARTLGRELLKEQRVRVLLHAAVTELLAEDSDYSRVTAVVLRAPTGRRLSVHADHVVLAAGTIETVRLLLASRGQTSAGLGNAHDQVGRNVHDHLTLTAATFSGAARERVLRELRPWVLAGARGSVVHSFKLEQRAKLDEDRDTVRIMTHLIIEEPQGSGIEAVRALLHARQLRTESIAALRGLVPQLPSAVAAAAHLFWSARWHHRRYVSSNATVALRLNAAQVTPSPSRIMLSVRSDAYGQALPALDWIISEQECRSLGSYAASLRDELCLRGLQPEDMSWASNLFGKDGPGEQPWLGLTPHLEDARHLMGGAVMGADPCTSVVDANLQVHGVTNLHVASLATFPDGRAQLPTLTSMGLTLRLAERLGRMLRP